MKNFTIYTDSACDISPALLSEWGVAYSSLVFRFEEEEKEYLNGEMDVGTFYEKMREGKSAKTSAINSELFCRGFEPILQKGEDILYLGFSSGLSTTYNSARVASVQLAEKYPERKIITIDTLS
ncbi:MAG: DegV family protein, partial [Clostridia bacterium]|nr:DegV family protein [Clostridia bacterium]